MGNSFSDVKKRNFERRKAELVEECEAASAALGRVLDSVARLRIQR